MTKNKDGSITFNLYPKFTKPSWLKIGTKVHCLGEAQDIFTVDDLNEKNCSSSLLDSDGCVHGIESWSKLSLVSKCK